MSFQEDRNDREPAVASSSINKNSSTDKDKPVSDKPKFPSTPATATTTENQAQPRPQMEPIKTSKPVPNRPIAPAAVAAAATNVMSMASPIVSGYHPPPIPVPGYAHPMLTPNFPLMRGPMGSLPPPHGFHVPFGASAAAISASAHPKGVGPIRTTTMPPAPKIPSITPHLPQPAPIPSQTSHVSSSGTTTSRPSSPLVPATTTAAQFHQQSSEFKPADTRDRGSPHVVDIARKAASPRSTSPPAPNSASLSITGTKPAITAPVISGNIPGQPLMLTQFTQGQSHSPLAVATFPQPVIPPPSVAPVCISQSQPKPSVPVGSLTKMFPSHVSLVPGRPGIGQAEAPASPDISRLSGKQSAPASPVAIPQHSNTSSTVTSTAHLIPTTAPLPAQGVIEARLERPHQGVTMPSTMIPNMYSQYVLSEHSRGYPLSFPHSGFHQPLPSGIRPPHTQTTAAMSGMHILDHQSIFANNALRNLGAGAISSEALGPVAMVDSSAGNPNIYSMQIGMQQAPNLQVAVSASNPNATSPRPSILRKRTSEGIRKPTIVPYNNDVPPPPVASEPSASPRSDSTLSAPQSGQSSPKPPSDAGNQSEQQQQPQPQQSQAVTSTAVPPTEQIPTSQPLSSPVTVKKEQAELAVSTAASTAVTSSTAMPTSTSSTVDKPATNAAALPDGASPRKKPRKQNVVATEDKYGSSVPLEEASSDDEDKKAKQPAEDPMDDDLKFILCKRPKISIFGGYKVNTKAAYNHFQKYSDVRIKEERKPTVQDIANQKNILHRVSGWRVHHVAAQMDDLSSVEQQVLQKLFEFRENLPKPRPGQKTKYHDELIMLDELVQGNIQRCQLVAEQLADIRKVMVKVLDHRPKCVEILQKHMHKRNPKKKS